MEVRYKYSIRSADIDEPSKIGSHFNYRDYNKKSKRFRYPLDLSIYPELWDKETQKPTKDRKIIKKFKTKNPHIETDISNPIADVSMHKINCFSFVDVCNIDTLCSFRMEAYRMCMYDYLCNVICT